jgi:hypothetical protein
MLAMAALASWAGSASAQSESVSVPANIILPNYERIPVGQEEALEAGAWIARTNDALANWYNPAGLVLAPGTAVNASANSYRGTQTSLEGIETTARSTRIQSVGSFFGGVIKKPLTESDRWRFGFSFTTPLAWQPGLIDAEAPSTAAAGEEATLVMDSDLSTLIPGVAASYAAAPSFRVGAGLGVGITNFDQRQTITLRGVSADSASNLTRSVATGGSTANAVFTGGVQWDVTPQVRFGAFAASPGIRLYGSSRVNYDRTNMTGTSFEDAHFRDPEARFEYAVPFRAGAGIAWIGERGAVEIDVRTYGSEDEYNLFETTEVGVVTVTDASGTPTTTAVELDPVTNAWGGVTNVAVGGNWRLTNSMRVHAGFGTDQSPVEDRTRGFFWDVDLVNVTSGVSIEGERFSGSGGRAYSGGSSETLEITSPETGGVIQTKLVVRSVSLAYALSFKF